MQPQELEKIGFEDEKLQTSIERARTAIGAKQALKQGIGTQSERMLHSVLKYYFDPDPEHHEISVGPYIADVFQPENNRILEIQTRDFERLRQKLAYFLDSYQVTVIHPIPREKYLFWVDQETGETYEGHKSPKRGTEAAILKEIYHLPDLQMHPNLTFLPVMMDVAEYRLMDGYSRDGKKGSHRLERMPYRIETGGSLHETDDYRKLVPELPEAFTSRDIGKAMHEKSHVGDMIRVLERAGAIERTGKCGRAYLYSISRRTL